MTKLPRNVWSGINMTLTHIGLAKPGAVDVRTQRRATVLTMDQRRAVLLVLSGQTPVETAALQDHLSWPIWQAPAVPEQDFDWKAVFNSANRTFEGFYNESERGDDQQIVHMPSPARLTDDMWRMVEKTRATVMCVGLNGDPTLQTIAHAAQQHEFHAVLVEALFR